MLQDLRFAARLLRRSPVFTAVGVLSLALGIGANTAIFSVMDALLLRSLPVRRPQELVLFGDAAVSGISDSFPSGNFSTLYSIPFFQGVRANSRTLSGVTAIESMVGDVHARLAGSLEPEPVHIRLVSGEYFDVLGVGASAGRVLERSDDQRGARPVAVMSHAFWERRFARAPMLGQSLSFNGTSFTIVGVAAREFFGTVVGESPNLWVPLAMQPQVQPWLHDPAGELSQSLWMVGRLRPGVTREAAQSEARVLYHAWMQAVAGAHPSADQIQGMREARMELTDASRGFSRLRRRYSQPLLILMVVAGLVLLIACVNLANLLLARASARQREIAVRRALGAGRGRLAAQLLSESMLLALAGGLVGTWMATWCAELLIAMVASGPDAIPLQTGLDARLLLFAAGLSVCTGIGFGILPALRLSRGDLGGALKENKGAAARSHNGFGRVLVGAQVGLALFLMIGAGLFVRTLQNLEQTDTGFDKDHVVLLQMDADSTPAKGAALLGVYRRIEQRVRALPKVRAAAYSMLAFDDGVWASPLWLAGRPHDQANLQDCTGNRVDPEFFAAMGMPVVMGRGFNARDTRQSPHVAVINETLARKLFPNGSPLGHHFSLGGHDHYDFEIAGVVKDAHYESLREKPQARWFIDNDQEDDADGFNDLVVRAQGDPRPLIAGIRAEVRAADPNLAIAEVGTLAGRVERSLGTERLLARLASLFGGLALLLASLGLYGVLAYSVARRTNEIGIRMALGARPRAVLGLVLRESLAVVAAGIAVGIGAELVCARLVRTQLFGIAPHDPIAIGAATGMLLLVALAAAVLPARRAAHLDPLSALREE